MMFSKLLSSWSILTNHTYISIMMYIWSSTRLFTGKHCSRGGKMLFINRPTNRLSIANRPTESLTPSKCYAFFFVAPSFFCNPVQRTTTKQGWGQQQQLLVDVIFPKNTMLDQRRCDVEIAWFFLFIKIVSKYWYVGWLVESNYSLYFLFSTSGSVRVPAEKKQIYMLFLVHHLG